jgi:PhnB protein
MATVTAHIIVREAGRAAEWYERALGAQVGNRIQVPDGRYMQIELVFGDSQVMIADVAPDEVQRRATALLSGGQD